MSIESICYALRETGDDGSLGAALAEWMARPCEVKEMEWLSANNRMQANPITAKDRNVATASDTQMGAWSAFTGRHFAAKPATLLLPLTPGTKKTEGGRHG